MIGSPQSPQRQGPEKSRSQSPCPKHCPPVRLYENTLKASLLTCWDIEATPPSAAIGQAIQSSVTPVSSAVNVIVWLLFRNLTEMMRILAITVTFTLETVTQRGAEVKAK